MYVFLLVELVLLGIIFIQKFRNSDLGRPDVYVGPYSDLDRNIYLDRCSKSVRAGYGNVDLPWLYTQPLQNIGDANVCIVLGK